MRPNPTLYRALAICVCCAFLYYALGKSSARASRSSKWTLEAQLGQQLAHLPPPTTVPILLPLDARLADTAVLLSRTLASLRRVDSIATTPLVVLYDFGAPSAPAIREVLRGVTFAPLVELTTPPAEDASRGLYLLLKHVLGGGTPFRGCVALPAGVEVSQDVVEFARWALSQLEREGGTLRQVFAVNLYYSKGQGFGGSERYTLATEEVGLQPWGAVLPRSALPLIRQVYGASGTAWQAALVEALKARELRVLTPRISRSRPIRQLADVSPGGESMYIPDHSLDYAGRTMLLVPRH